MIRCGTTEKRRPDFACGIRRIVPSALGAAPLFAAGPAEAAEAATVTLLISGFAMAVALVAAAGLAALAWRRSHRLATECGTLSAAFEALPAAVAATAADGARLFTNAAWDRLMAGSGDRPLAHIEACAGDLAEVRADLVRLRAASASGERAESEIALVDADGRKRWCRLAAHRLPGRPGGVLWVLTDAAARNELAATLQAEQDRLAALLADAPMGFFAVDRDGRFLAANRTFAGWLGIAPESLADGSWRLHEIVSGADPVSCPPWSAFPGGDGEGDVTMRGQRREFSARLAISALPDEDGGPRARAFVRDLEGERQRAEALSESEKRFHRFVDEAPVGIAVLDGSGTITECSAAFSRMAKPGGAVGSRLTALVGGDERPRIAQFIAAAMASDEPAAPLQVAFRGDGEAVALLFARRFVNEAGEFGLVLHAIDHTEQRRLEAQFFQSQKMELVGQLAGGVAHDFNNLLTAMIGFCDLLLQRHSAKDQSFADIMQIKQNANRAANLVRQLLAFSRQQTLQPKVLDITDVVAELSHLLRRLIGANIELKLVHGRDLWLVKVDQSQFEQVIINLAVNARDAIGGAGTLTIRTRNLPAAEASTVRHGPLPATDYVLIEVTDTGCGIPKELLDKIFEPFFTTKAVGSGTGLGLSTVYGIVKQTGGHIFVDSEPGRGASFVIYVPRHEGASETARPTDEPPAAEPGRDLTGMGAVLLVEDEDAVRMFGARALRNKGYSVVEASSGEAALKLLDDSDARFDVLISDVVMPGMDGPSMVRRVRDRHPEMKVIFISGYTEDSLRKRMEVAGHVHFLAKPFTLQQLAGKVKEIMAEGEIPT